MARTVTSASRLLDVLPLFRSDPRVQVLFTVAAGSAFDDGIGDYLRDVEARVVSWAQAVDTPFDLAVSASANGDLHRLRAPLLLVPHGAGHNRLLSAAGGVSGLARRQLVRDGRLVPAAIALSHHEQLTRLAGECPEAVPLAVVTGDPCFDRILANAARRDRYRRALGTGDRKLVLISSTWGEHSLLGANHDLVARLTAELPVDEYQVVLAAHPNVWYGHGGLQVRLWLGDALDAGLVLLPPRQGWQAALLAADVVVGDHGSVTFYGAALGRPTLLASSGREAEELDPASPTAALSRALPRLDPRRDLPGQIGRIMDTYRPGAYDEVTERTLGESGRAGTLLRQVAYRLMDLEPGPEPAATALPDPLGERGEVLSFLVEAEVQDGTVSLRRFPVVGAGQHVRDPHLVVDAEEPDRRRLETAAIIVRGDPADGWAAETLRRYPGCLMTAEVTGTRRVRLALRDGRRFEVTASAGTRGELDPRCLPSAVYGWLTHGDGPLTSVRVGARETAIDLA
ncbi:hypothetical protein [Nonomuraea aurantiaca]|uniref:hypothetical protein n=1 Tax=Nonomuraea aurantiaca TaxID=2878562 RepID=UPI001CD929A1|nr:hypothetical protein [Nonomuraea aurantiaca]MCA2228915.1 hypothetical protein [Nonomuraea aurantiaca]